MRLLLLLLLYPVISFPQCAPGDIGGSCAQVKSEHYHVRGERVRPYWTHAIHGGREVRRRQSSSPAHTFEKPTLAYNMWRQPLYPPRLPQPVQRFPLHPVQPHQSFEISGAVQRQANLPKRSHGVRNLALNQDPIDSFERALAGDEFDNRRPIEPIRVIKIESAEVLEPVVPHRGIGSSPRKTQKIIESLTRHMNEIRQPKVIPFPRRDEIVNGEIVSPSEVKITKVQTTEVTKEVGDVSSAELANEIVDNILNGSVFAKNASTLLTVLTDPEQRMDANETETSTTVDPDEEVLQELNGPSANETDSTLLSAKHNEERINVIGSEIDDYTDEDWDEFSDTGPRITRRPRPSTTPTVLTGAAMTISSTPSTSSSVRTATTTTSKRTTPTRARNVAEQEIDLENLEDDFGDFEDNGTVEDEPATTMTTRTPTTTTSRRRRTTKRTTVVPTTLPTTTATAETEEEEPVGAAAQAITEQEPEEADESSEEEATTSKTTLTEQATTITSLREGFRAAIREQQKKVLRMRVGEEDEGVEEEGEATEAPKDITELNSMTLITIEKQKKKKEKRPKKVKGVEEGKEKEEEEKDEEKKVDPPKEVVEALRQNLADIGVGGDEMTRKKKSKKGKKIRQEAEDDADKSTDEAIADKILDQIDTITTEDQEENKEEEEILAEVETEEKAGRKSKPKTKNKPKKEKEDEEEEEEEEPVGAGAQRITEAPALRVKTRDETIVTVKKPNNSKVKKANGKNELAKKKLKTEDEEQVEEEEEKVEKEEEEEEEIEATTEQSEEPEAEEETMESIPKKTKKGKEKKTQPKAAKKEEIEEEEESQTSTGKPIEIGSEHSNIRTDKITASLKDAPNAKYYYPPKITVPLPSCFYNPSGYVCCNLQLNNLIEDTFEEIKNVQGYSACNIAKMANIIQEKSEKMFEHPFESIVALSDFAQNVHFAGDLVCKVEIDGKYLLTYATPYDADNAVESVAVAETPAPEVEEEEKGEKSKKKKEKKPKKMTKKALPIHNFRM